MLLWRQTLVDGGWMRGPPCPRWELVKREKYSQAGSLLSICFIKLFGFWIHVSNKSLSPSEWQITPESSVRKAAGPTTAAEIGSSGHTWRLLRKPQESAISPPPTPALAGFLTLSLSHLGGLRDRWEAAGQTHLNLGISFTFTSSAFEMLSLIFIDLPHPQ